MYNFDSPCHNHLHQAIGDQFSREGYELWRPNIKQFKFKRRSIRAKLEMVDGGWIVSLNSPDQYGVEVSICTSYPREGKYDIKFCESGK